MANCHHYSLKKIYWTIVTFGTHHTSFWYEEWWWFIILVPRVHLPMFKWILLQYILSRLLPSPWCHFTTWIHKWYQFGRDNAWSASGLHNLWVLYVSSATRSWYVVPNILLFSFYCFIILDPESDDIPDSKVHGANMGPTWILSAPGGYHVGPMNLAIRDAS